MATPEDIAHRFAFHPATTEEKRDAHTSVREKALALTACEEAMLRGNAALARAEARQP